jgi:hypothetical protein
MVVTCAASLAAYPTNCSQMAKNERKTENIVREELRRHGFYEVTSDIQVDEQKSVSDHSTTPLSVKYEFSNACVHL